MFSKCRFCATRLYRSAVLKGATRNNTRIAFSRILDGKIDSNTQEFDANLQHNKRIEKTYLDVLKVAHAGGGEKAVERHVKRNKKLLAKDRIKLLLDDDSDFLELSPLCGMRMEYGDVPRGGIIAGIGKVHGKHCMILANEATVKGGTLYPIAVKKQLRSQAIAEQNRLPCIYLVDSGGAFLPLQAEIFPDQHHGGRVFYNMAIMGAKGIPQIAVVCGSCTAGGAYIPTMSDQTVIVQKIGHIFLGGPPLVHAATGEVVTTEELGGAELHSSVSGCTDYFAHTEEEGLEYGRDIVASLNIPDRLGHSSYEEPQFSPEELPGLVPSDLSKSLDITKILARIVDGSRFHEFKAKFGCSLKTGFSHIHGHLVGIVANDGPLSEQEAAKGAHFVRMCDERKIPLIFFQDTGSGDFSSETNIDEAGGSALKCQSRLLTAVAVVSVPKITVIMRQSYGAENYMMAGRAMDPNFLFVWPTVSIGIQNEEYLLNNTITQLPAADLTKEQEASVKEKVLSKMSALYSSSRLWDDGIILPQNSRKVLGQCLDIVSGPLPPSSEATEPMFRM
ncbi:methylcrotonoyl-CoA carboxylase beta chain, mitochondrial [Lingula anatina]|uniref:methylcrotonoyl-CoA carboxylase n=1 Tax=Lingula anatina TaxID=7574 RepID=A0A2R2MLS2_LINAN|nr:methylcrotonoyl-CoA carboxylase beta chain, mitochondrial [Lingula anatina]|eukprot:XP_023931149.1 methylcrotonoyl-CoA carboxylase beta chain, mitochondrial [Lingula anatina]